MSRAISTLSVAPQTRFAKTSLTDLPHNCLLYGIAAPTEWISVTARYSKHALCITLCHIFCVHNRLSKDGKKDEKVTPHYRWHHKRDSQKRLSPIYYTIVCFTALQHQQNESRLPSVTANMLSCITLCHIFCVHNWLSKDGKKDEKARAKAKVR